MSSTFVVDTVNIIFFTLFFPVWIHIINISTAYCNSTILTILPNNENVCLTVLYCARHMWGVFIYLFFFFFFVHLVCHHQIQSPNTHRCNNWVSRRLRRNEQAKDVMSTLARHTEEPSAEPWKYEFRFFNAITFVSAILFI